jgi:hypothetical protein
VATAQGLNGVQPLELVCTELSGGDTAATVPVMPCASAGVAASTARRAARQAERRTVSIPEISSWLM